jgi:hypothetical protein
MGRAETHEESRMSAGTFAESENHSLAAARDYHRRGYSPLPIKPQRKDPDFEKWQQFRMADYDEENWPELFPPGYNVGLHLGAPSNGLAEIDCDAIEARHIAPHILRKTGMISGRPGSPYSHWWYEVTPPDVRRKAFAYKERNGTTQNVMLVEFRATGCQTLVVPSIHPSGEPYVWHQFEHPTKIYAADLLRLTQKIAIGALLARFWPPKGIRHDAALPIAGLFLSAGWEEEEAAHLVFLAAQAADHADPEDRRRVVHDTYRNHATGRHTQGIPSLKQIMPAEIVDWLALW